MNKIYIISLTLILNFKLFSTQHISPEISNALKKFDMIMKNNLISYQQPNKDNCLIKDNISVINKNFSISKLKSSNYWTWNQSNSKTESKYQNYQIVLRKYSPKKKDINDKNKLPKYKIWKYELFQDNQLKTIIFWTEKGEEIMPEQILNNEQEPIEIVPVNLTDLRFLVEFMEPLDALDIFF